MWNWMELDVEGLEGQVGIAALQKDDLTDEKYVLATWQSRPSSSL